MISFYSTDAEWISASEHWSALTDDLMNRKRFSPWKCLEVNNCWFAKIQRSDWSRSISKSDCLLTILIILCIYCAIKMPVHFKNHKSIRIKEFNHSINYVNIFVFWMPVSKREGIVVELVSAVLTKKERPQKPKK